MLESLTGAGAVRAALGDLMQRDERVVLLGDSVGRAGGVAGSTDGLLDRFGPDRVVDLPVADRAALGFAVGLALGGRVPVVELPSTGRLPAVVEVLAESARVAQGGEFRVPLVVRVAYGDEAKGLDRPVGDVLPDGVRVLCASDPSQAAALLRAAIEQPGPTVLLEPRSVHLARGTLSPEPARLAARVVRTGDHVTLAAWGSGVQAACSAAEELGREGISAEVVDLVSLAPLDRETLGASVRKTGRLVVVHPGDAALAARVQQVGLDEGFVYLESPLAAALDTPAAIAGAARSSATF